jgi:hypothetical protein
VSLGFGDTFDLRLKEAVNLFLSSFFWLTALVAFSKKFLPYRRSCFLRATSFALREEFD